VDDFRDVIRKSLGEMRPVGDDEAAELARERKARRQTVQDAFKSTLLPVVEVLIQTLESQDAVSNVRHETFARDNPDLTYYTGTRLRWQMGESHELTIALTANNAVSVSGGEANLVVILAPFGRLKVVTREWVRESGAVVPLFLDNADCVSIVQRMLQLIIAEGKTRVINNGK